MQKNILISFILAATSCTTLPESIGQANEIIVITSNEDQLLIEPQLSNLFSYMFYTPQPEYQFILEYRKPWELENYKKYGNIIIASLDYPEDSTADILIQRILATHNQNAQLLTLGDLYAKNQLLCIIHAQDAVELETILNTNNHWLLAEYYSQYEDNIMQTLFKNGKNNELSDSIYHMLGHTIDLQIDFQLIKSDSINSFIWVGRGYPYRWLTLYKTKKEYYMNIKSAWKHLENDFLQYMPEITISQHFRINEKINYGSDKIPTMRGIYEHLESDSGGPFFVYLFDTEQANEVILISGFVNYPGHKKLLLLKQLEIMAKTFH